METVISPARPYSCRICRIAAKYPSAMGLFRLTAVSWAPSPRTDTNTSTFPLEMDAFTACFTASSPKERPLGSFTVQSR